MLAMKTLVSMCICAIVQAHLSIIDGSSDNFEIPDACQYYQKQKVCKILNICYLPRSAQ